jgi:hypothetical protein
MIKANQKSCNGIEQGFRETITLVLRDIRTTNGDSVWDNPHVASPHGIRLWGLIPAKENRNLLAEMLPMMDKEGDEVEANLISVVLSDGTVIQVHGTPHSAFGQRI